jgi:MerR family transcriptional regulator, aldehyde-responsive regulator
MMNPELTYSIQEVSKKTKLPSSTLRYYEEIGLLEPIHRSAVGHRRFTEDDLRRLELIKRLRLLGMPLEAISEFVALYREGVRTARQRREILQSHKQRVQAHMEELGRTLEFIDIKIATYYEQEAEYEREQIEHDEVPTAG